MENFEFKDKVDERVEVTSYEEILRNECCQTKNVLETKEMELLELNVTIYILKGHKTLLSMSESLYSRIAMTQNMILLLLSRISNV
jgi:hypothetical protein